MADPGGTSGRRPDAARGRFVLLAALAALLAVACSSPSATGDEPRPQVTNVAVEDSTPVAEVQRGGKVAVGVGSDIPGWDPTLALWSPNQYLMTLALFDRLMAYDPDGEPVPFLAESMQPSPDFTSWTLVLRPDIRFSNGELLDADTVVRNLEAHRGSPITGASMELVESVEALDELTVRISMSGPWATFPHLLTSQVGMMMAPAMLDDEDRTRNPIGVGAFVLDEWVPGERVVVRANPDYWSPGRPYLDEVEFRIFTDTQSRVATFESGDLDMMAITDAPGIVRFLDLARDGQYQIFFDQDGENTETMVALNTASPPFDDPLARELLATALDTQLISDTLYDGFFEPARGPFKPGSVWYVDTDYPRFDPEEARRLAARYEASHGGPLRFEVNIPPGNEFLAAAQLAQEQLRAFGIEMEIVTLEQTRLLVEAIAGQYEATGFSIFGSEHLDREFVFLDGGSVDADVTLNITRMADPRVDEGLAAARRTTERSEQVAAYAEVQRGLAQDLRFVWLVHTESAVVARNDVRGVEDADLPDGTPAQIQEGTQIRLDTVWKAT